MRIAKLIIWGLLALQYCRLVDVGLWCSVAEVDDEGFVRRGCCVGGGPEPGVAWGGQRHSECEYSVSVGMPALQYC